MHTYRHIHAAIGKNSREGLVLPILGPVGHLVINIITKLLLNRTSTVIHLLIHALSQSLTSKFWLSLSLVLTICLSFFQIASVLLTSGTEPERSGVWLCGVTMHVPLLFEHRWFTLIPLPGLTVSSLPCPWWILTERDGTQWWGKTVVERGGSPALRDCATFFFEGSGNLNFPSMFFLSSETDGLGLATAVGDFKSRWNPVGFTGRGGLPEDIIWFQKYTLPFWPRGSTTCLYFLNVRFESNWNCSHDIINTYKSVIGFKNYAADV